MKKGSFFQILSLSFVAAFSNISTNAEEINWYEDEQTEQVESYIEDNVIQEVEEVETDWYENEQTEQVESYTEDNVIQEELEVEEVETDWYENEQTVDDYEIYQSDNDTTTDTEETELCVDYEDNIIPCE